MRREYVITMTLSEQDKAARILEEIKEELVDKANQLQLEGKKEENSILWEKIRRFNDIKNLF